MKNHEIENWLQSRSYLQALLLDSLIDGKDKTFKEIFDFASSKFNFKLNWKLPAVLIFVYLKDLKYLGLVELIKIPDNPKDFDLFYLDKASCRITELGLTAIRNQSFHGVASSSFFDSSTITLSRRVFWISVFSVILAFASIFITISSSRNSIEEYEELRRTIELKRTVEPITFILDSSQLQSISQHQDKELN